LKNNKKILKNNEELIEQNNKTHKMNEDLLKSNKSMEKSLNKANHKLDETLEKLDEVHEELENTHEELEDTNEKLDITDKNLKIVAKKLDIAVEDRVVKTKSKLKNESFIVMYNANEEYKYKVIRGKKEYVDIRINKLEIKNYIQKDELSLNNVPNASTLWCLIKEELKNDIDSCHNKLKLINIDELQFKIKINEIYNKRKTVLV
jgi:light-regulated signal transduction histidine kinase (bacteriophytochrome)